MMTPRLPRRTLVLWSSAVAAVIASCNLHNKGVSPPEAALSYPSALALSREATPRFLYVANSNFDLRYNGGSVQSYDLARLDGVIEKCRRYGNFTLDADGGKLPFATDTRVYTSNTRYPVQGLLDAGTQDGSVGADAGDAGPGLGFDSLDGGADAGSFVLPANYDLTAAYGNARGVLCDGRDPSGFGLEECCFDSEAKLDAIRQGAFELDSYAAGLAVGPVPNEVAAPGASRDRVYVPVASENRLVYLDVDNGNFSCGETQGRCRRGPHQDAPDDDPDHDFPGQLTDIAIGTLGDLIPAGQEQGLDRGRTYLATTHELGGFTLFTEQGGAPVLESVLEQLGRRPRSVTADPRSQLLYVTSAGDRFISRIGLRVSGSGAAEESAPREVLYESSRITVSGVSQPDDLRDLAVDPNRPNRLYTLIRGTQEAVAVLDVDSTLSATNARVIDVVRIGAGPSKLIVIVQDGKTFLLVSCYDSKSVYVIDPETRLLVAQVRSFSGPFSMVYDASRKLLHVADFRASILRVVDLKGLTDKTEPPPRIVATIGSPQFEGGVQ